MALNHVDVGSTPTEPTICKCPGCDGYWGPGCYYEQQHPLAKLCRGNKEFWKKVVNSVESTNTR